MEYSKNFNFALPSRDNDVDLADINEIANNFRKVDKNATKKQDFENLKNEVEDARVSYDGTVYGSLGNAIREQTQNVKSDIDEVKKVETTDGVEKTIHFKQDGKTLSAVLSQKAVVSGNDNPLLDEVAYGGKTYRDIFVTKNIIPFGNFFDDKFTVGDFPSAGIDGFTIGADGTPKITNEIYYSAGLSLDCSGTSSKNIRKLNAIKANAGTYYIAFKGRVDRYESGYLGVQAAIGSSILVQNSFTGVTEGFVTQSCLIEAPNGTSFNIGSYTSANLDGYMDDIVIVKVSDFDEIPTKETMDALYEQYLELVKQPSETVTSSEEIIISQEEEQSEETEYTAAECIAAFMEKVNAKASELGMSNSVFNYPSGAGDNSATARDLVKLLISASGYNDLVKVWGKDTKTIHTKGENSKEITLETTVNNAILEKAYYIFGGKTGTWVTSDGTTYNLATIGEINGKQIAGVVLGATTATTRFVAMKSLFDNAKKIIENPEIDKTTLSVAVAECACCCIVPEYNVFGYENYPFNFLFEQNADTVKLPASITKVISAMVMLDYVTDLHETLDFISSDKIGGSGAVFDTGDVITYEDALYAMMLSSSNMTAQCVARNVGKKILELG